MNVHGINNSRQTEIHKTELVSDPTVFEFEVAIENLKRHKTSGIDQIPAELIKAGGRTICFEIRILINSVSNRGIALAVKWVNHCTYL